MVNSLPADPADPLDEELAEIRERAFKAAAIPMYLTEVGPDGRHSIAWVNDAFTTLTGYSFDEVRGRWPGILMDQGLSETAAIVEGFRAAIAAGESRADTMRMVSASGEGAWTRVSIAPVPSADGPVRHWVYALADMTDFEARHQQQLAQVAYEREQHTSLSIVSQVSDLIMELDDPHALGQIASLLEHTIVRWAGFYLNDDGLRAADGTPVQPARPGPTRRHGALRRGEVPSARVADPVQEMLDGTRTAPVDLRLDGDHPASTATGWLLREVEPIVASLTDPPSTIIVMPLPGRRRVLGVQVVVADGGGGYDTLESTVQTVLHLVVRRVGLAIDNVRLYAREHLLAETLQRSMLPEQAEVDGLDVWTYYAPNSEHAQVGGDWYDVLQIAPDTVGVVIGDVVGHDVEAAASMGQLRSVVRTYAFEVTTPGAVLERVDQLVAGMRVPRPAALVLTTLSRREDGWHIEYSRAGHLPALLVRSGRVVKLDEAGGTLIGFGGAPRTTARVDALPGDFLVFYTDGLIERRDRALRTGLSALCEVAAGITAIDAAGIGEELLSRLADNPEDDVAVVVVRVPDPEDELSRARSPRSRRWRLPSEAPSAGRARHAVLRTCEAWGLTCGPAAELVVSELVANAVLHGWGHVSLRLDDTDDGLRIEVEDANPVPPVATDGHPGRVGGFGMQIVGRLSDWGWRPSGTGKVVWARIRATDRAGLSSLN